MSGPRTVKGPTAFDLALTYVAGQLAKGSQASAWLQRDRPARCPEMAVTRALRALRDAGHAIKGERYEHGFMWSLRAVEAAPDASKAA